MDLKELTIHYFEEMLPLQSKCLIYRNCFSPIGLLMHVVALPLGLFDARSFKKRISSERIRWGQKGSDSRSDKI